jgi:predicted RNase H-like nuclease (RuvC/YqgF family)
MSNQYYQLSEVEKDYFYPVPDPTIQLQHSLTQALNECDELRQKNERLMVIIEELQSDLDTAKNDLTVADAAIEELKSVTLDPYIANQKLESQIKEQDRTISNLKDQIDGRDAALRGSTIEYKKLYQQIQILQENLTRSNSDRLSELTSIMRMVQALESIPMLDRLSGAIDLIKRVIYDAICKLDPSQAVDP